MGVVSSTNIPSSPSKMATPSLCSSHNHSRELSDYCYIDATLRRFAAKTRVHGSLMSLSSGTAATSLTSCWTQFTQGPCVFCGPRACSAALEISRQARETSLLGLEALRRIRTFHYKSHRPQRRWQTFALQACWRALAVYPSAHFVSQSVRLGGA